MITRVYKHPNNKMTKKGRNRYISVTITEWNQYLNVLKNENHLVQIVME